jgi:hypothetical protein
LLRCSPTPVLVNLKRCASTISDRGRSDERGNKVLGLILTAAASALKENSISTDLDGQSHRGAIAWPWNGEIRGRARDPGAARGWRLPVINEPVSIGDGNKI